MALRFSMVLVFACCISTQPVLAQDDVPWWRQLFGQSEAVKTPSNVPLEVDSNAQVGQEPAAHDESGETGESVNAAAPMEQVFGMAVRQGSVDWNIPLAIEALDSLQSAPDEVRIPGFRIQLFMGKLDSARSLRHALVNRLDFEHEVHLTPYPPLFGVQVGDFRTFLAAHRIKRGLEGAFPNALVVPADLLPERAFPTGFDCIRTP